MSESDRAAIYISYRWRGAKDIADALTAELSAALPGVDVFQDSASLQPGDHWPTRLQEALNLASVLLVLIDRDWLRYADEYGRRRLDNPEDWVRLEIERALTRGVPILPILLDEAVLPPAQGLPESLRPLTQFQAISLRSHDSGAIAERIRSLLTGSPSPVAGAPGLTFQLLDLELTNFRCFEQLELDFSSASSLDGDWTCVAGINGAGKSTILQAIALLLLGPEFARELGGRRLQAMRRLNSQNAPLDAHLRRHVRLAGEAYVVELSLTSRGPQANDQTFWSRSRDLLCVGYGASRNISDTPDHYDDLSRRVSGIISLFDPMARLQRAQALFETATLNPELQRARSAFELILGNVFAEELTIHRGEAGLVMTFDSGGPSVSVLDLPDGFRSSVAWLADLCVRWAALNTSGHESLPSLDTMSGLVMVDEVDLHLHASLQRAIVPRLRRALPGLQWIVTSHAPLVLASFDRTELIPLEEDGIRLLDRQIFGFSADQVYDFLLRTLPSSEVLEEQLGESAQRPQSRREELEALLGAEPYVSEEESKARIARIQQRMRELKR